MSGSLRDQVLAMFRAPLVKKITVDGDELCVRMWSDRECSEWSESLAEADRDESIRCKAVVSSICNDKGELLFCADDLPCIAEMPKSKLIRVFGAILTAQSESLVDDAKKNSTSSHG